MWQKRLAASLVTVAVAAALISLLWLHRMLSGVEPQRWSSWHLPVSCGLFLRALTLFLIGYLLWLCLAGSRTCSHARRPVEVISAWR